MRGASLLGSFCTMMLVAGSAVAQTAPPTTGTAPAPPPQPPAAAQQAPPAQAAPPPYPGYPPRGAYPGYPPQGYSAPYRPPKPPPTELAYHEGMAIPPGYHVESSIRKGPVIAGAIVLGVPYMLGLAFAGAVNYGNQGGWLFVPGAGPWLTLGLRDHSCNSSNGDCVGEALVRTFLVFDAIMQTTGATLLIWGLADKKTRVVRNDVVRVIGVAPTRVGSGYGLGLFGTF